MRKLEQPAAEAVLVGYFGMNAGHLSKRRLSNAFWSEKRELALPLIEWLESPAIQSRVWKHYGA